MNNKPTSSTLVTRIACYIATAACLFGTTALSADTGNSDFHKRFINNVGTQMQTTSCDSGRYKLNDDGTTSMGDCFQLTTKDRISEVGSVSYTVRAYSVEDDGGNQYAIFTLHLNTSARTGFVEMAPQELLKMFASQESKSWQSWTDVSKMKVSFLKRAQQQFASNESGARCSAVSGRRSPSVLYMAATCGEVAATAESMQRVVRSTL